MIAKLISSVFSARQRIACITLLLFCMLASLQTVSGQDEYTSLDSLQKLIAEPGISDKRRLDLYGLIAGKVGKIDADTAALYIERCMSLALKLNDMQAYAKALGHLGSLEERKGRYDAAFASYTRMAHMADSMNDDVLRFLSYSELGNYYLDQKNHEMAIKYARKILNTMDYHGADNGVTTLFNLGISYAYSGILDSAQMVFNDGLAQAEKLQSDDLIGLHLSGLSMVAYYEGRTDEGMDLVRRAIEKFRLSDNKGQLLSALVTLGAYHYQDGEFDEAISKFKQALKYAREVSSLSQEITITSNIAVVSSDAGYFEQAYHYLDTASVLQDSLLDIEKQKVVEEMEAKFELANKERDIALLKEKAQGDALKIAKQTQFNIGLAVVLLLSAVVLIVLWRNNILRKRANQSLMLEKQLENQKRIELELANEKLLNENTRAQFEILKNQVDPHFMFNALNTLVSIIRTDNHQALGFVRSLSTLFRSMLELKSEHLVPLSEELKHTEAYLHLQKVRFGESLTVEVHCSDLSLKKFLPPFSLQQVVENAIKHNRVFSREPLHIEISADEQRVTVANALNLRSNLVKSTKTGLENIRSRYALLADVKPAFYEKDGKYFSELPLVD